MYLVLTKDFDFGLRLDQYKIKSIGQDRVYGEDLSSLTSNTKLGATIRFPEGLENTSFMKGTIPMYIKVKGITHLYSFHAHVEKSVNSLLGYFVTCKFYAELLSFLQSSLI